MSAGPISNLEYHVLLAMAEGPRYGYAIKTAVETESKGRLTPRAGSLYRVLARLMTWGLVDEAEQADDGEPHPGRTRRYYALTSEGRAVLATETRHLEAAVALARERLNIAGGP